MSRPQPRRLGVLALLLAALLPVLACNFPLTRRALPTTEPGLPLPGFESTPSPVPTDDPLPSSPTASAPYDFPGLSTAAPGVPAPAASQAAPGSQVYRSQPGDTLAAVAKRFEVEPDQIQQGSPLLSTGLLEPGTPLTIASGLPTGTYPAALLPDSEVIDSPSSAGFDISGFIAASGGYLASYDEIVAGEDLTGAQIVKRVSIELGVSPRLLLSILELRSGWVLGQPTRPDRVRYPVGFAIPGQEGLNKELKMAAQQLVIGYYGWRSGERVWLEFAGGARVRISPGVNAGTAALQAFFAKLYHPAEWTSALYGPEGLAAVHARLFGDPWQRAAAVEPLFPAGSSQPVLELPFPTGETWRFSGGPHYAWMAGSPWGALDFAPLDGGGTCRVAPDWVTASAAGVVVRDGPGLLVLDLDGDGYEQTGWDLLYLHLAAQDRLPVGADVHTGDRLGHPSCEGGEANGPHVHLARKYNGEWIPATGGLPFVLSGWEATPGIQMYEGGLIRGEQRLTIRTGDPYPSTVAH